LSASLIVLFAFASGCTPEERCSGKQYFDSAAYICRLCPMGTTFKNGTCKCKDQYEFVDNRCVLMDGAVIETPDAGTEDSGAADTAAPAALSCMDYCDFAKSCIGDNGLAKAALSDVVSGLHADDAAACTSNCKSELGDGEASDPVVACIEAGREAAACAGDSSQTAIAAAFTLLADCCRPRQENALCKSICVPLKANPLTSGMVDFCK
jgi:hypothetical protein